MTEDASLDQFLGGGDDAEVGENDSSADESDGTAKAQSDASSGGESTDGTEVTPAVTTYAWSGEGAACGACGESVERRWRQDGTLVCSACKAWDEP